MNINMHLYNIEMLALLETGYSAAASLLNKAQMSMR